MADPITVTMTLAEYERLKSVEKELIRANLSRHSARDSSGIRIEAILDAKDMWMKRALAAERRISELNTISEINGELAAQLKESEENAARYYSLLLSKRDQV